jgi:DNA modification methylase
MTINRIILGDNLDILKQIENNSVNLIYLGPPFFSNRDYEVIWGDEGRHRYQFKAGLHHITVKVVDNDGLENIEVIKLQVNGKIKKHFHHNIVTMSATNLLHFL